MKLAYEAGALSNKAPIEAVRSSSTAASVLVREFIIHTPLAIKVPALEVLGTIALNRFSSGSCKHYAAFGAMNRALRFQRLAWMKPRPTDLRIDHQK
jgi:hypothetical protein